MQNGREKDQQIKELNEKIIEKSKEIAKMKSELKCEKCDFKADTLTMFLVHLSKKHNAGSNRKLKCRECDISFTNTKNLQTSNIEDKKTSSCDKCDFTCINQFDLLIHKSSKHPSYILNSQPEALTGPLH